MLFVIKTGIPDPFWQCRFTLRPAYRIPGFRKPRFQSDE